MATALCALQGVASFTGSSTSRLMAAKAPQGELDGEHSRWLLPAEPLPDDRKQSHTDLGLQGAR